MCGGAAHRGHGPGEPVDAMAVEQRQPAGVELAVEPPQPGQNLLLSQRLEHELRGAQALSRILVRDALLQQYLPAGDPGVGTGVSGEITW